MQKLLTLSILLPSFAMGQSLVSTSPELRTGLLEDFTGIHCGYCPEGHVIMADLADVYPDRISLVGVHAGGYAVPANTSEPDFRTPEGTAIDAFYNISGYPAGVINRHTFDGDPELGRGAWATSMAAILDMPSPVNLGMESSFDAGTSELTVHVQLYYTGESPQGDDHISVLVTEDHLIGWQTDYNNGNNPNYDHKHVLREYLTDIWGEGVGNPAAGTTVDRTYTLTVPAEWDIANCHVVAFVGEYQSDVYQARTVAADGGATQVAASLGQLADPYQSGANAIPSGFTAGLFNQVGGSADFVVNLTTVDAPASWGTSLDVDGNTISNGATITLADAASAQLTAQITPDNAPGIGNYLLTVTSVDFPDAAPMQQEIHVISGVHDLIVSNTEAAQWDALYTAAMDQANELAYAKTSRGEFIKFGQADALGEVLNIYRNVSWTFPSLTDDEVAVLTSFMDNGGNLMIAGQDIGWDQSGATGAYGTTATQAFYTGYLLADFRWDGGTANSTVNFMDGDAIFGAVQNTSIANVFSGNTYPDRITPIAPAEAIFTYNAPDSIGGIRAQTPNYKLVYFGVGPEQMADAAVGRQMIQLSHDWFYGMVGIAEFDDAIGSLGQAYPVPADGTLNIPVNELRGDATLEVFDAMGRMVMQQPARRVATHIVLDTRELGSGVYSYRLRTANATGASSAFVVTH